VKQRNEIMKEFFKLVKPEKEVFNVPLKLLSPARFAWPAHPDQ